MGGIAGEITTGPKGGKILTRDCETCDNAFTRKIKPAQPMPRFCSLACAHTAQLTAEYEDRRCVVCEGTFRFALVHERDATRGSKGLYCSNKCAGIGRQHKGMTKVCTRCKQEKPVAEFRRRGPGGEVPISECSPCSRARTRDSYSRHREKILAAAKQAGVNLRLRVLRHYSGGTPRCACCGEDRYEFLAIDHLHGGGERHRKEVAAGQAMVRWLMREGFPKGYQVLCHNCNMARGFHGECPHERERREAATAD